MAKVTMWTFQAEAAARRLLAEGVLRPDGRRAERDRRPAYRWMTDQLRARSGAPARGCLWAWAWPRPTGRHLCPQDRGRCASGACSHWLRDDVGAVLFEVAVPAERVVASQLLPWSWYPLNRWYLPDPDEERRLEEHWGAGEEGAVAGFEERARARLGPDRHHHATAGALPVDLEAELRASWERVLVPATGPFPPDPAWVLTIPALRSQLRWARRVSVPQSGYFQRPIVQAVVAELRRADVVRWRPVVRRDGRVRLGGWREGAGVDPAASSGRQRLGR